MSSVLGKADVVDCVEPSGALLFAEPQCCPADALVLSGLPWNSTTEDVLAFLSPVVPAGGVGGLFMTYNSA